MLASLLLAAAAAAAPLFARASEDWFGLAPCTLCLWQRWPYWAAAALALLAALLGGRARAAAYALAVAAVVASGTVAAFHVGVEQGWWPSPLAGCQAPVAAGPLSLDDMLRQMPATPAKPCDAPTYLLPGLPVSMAAKNLAFALALAALAWRHRPRGGQVARPPAPQLSSSLSQ